LEDQVREIQNQAYIEGRGLHLFQEITDILEFVPEGYELSNDEDSVGDETGDEEEIDVGEGFDLETDEKIEEDDTMRWDEDSEAEEGKDSEEEEEENGKEE
jgi:hypothetical protein